ncbi:hypothetical protein [Aurantiacibacter odishensis]|uniref:hypothetical protein n=1 Tax=Aurantiacibacter odishensis TaxID=1155476 RepID=UPI0013C52D0A|nr:hypothetical protein [Aurantiacibacter odishensis]
MAGLLNRVARRARVFRRDRSGSVGAEMAFVAGFLAILIAQILDFGWMAYCSVQVRTAAQAAAAEAASLCQQETDLPATINCETTQSIDLQEKMEQAANRVSIGDASIPRIVVSEPSEGYFCQDSNETLVEVGTLASPPAADACATYGTAEEPGIYVYATASYTFNPLFPGLSVASVLGNPLTAEGWMRLD